MKKLSVAIICMMLSLQSINASTRADVNILEATEHIRYLSQELVAKYLYFYANPKKISLKNELSRDLDRLVSDIRTIAITTNNQDTKDMLEFLTYSKNELEKILSEKPDKDKALQMLDYSETLLEGANNIAEQYKFVYSDSDKMFLNSKNFIFYLERVLKYYMAQGLGLSSPLIKEQMKKAVSEAESRLAEIKGYNNYPESLVKNRKDMMRYWDTSKVLIKKENTLFVSNIMVLTDDKLEEIADLFVIYHSKNQ